LKTPSYKSLLKADCFESLISSEQSGFLLDFRGFWVFWKGGEEDAENFSLEGNRLNDMSSAEQRKGG